MQRSSRNILILILVLVFGLIFSSIIGAVICLVCHINTTSLNGLRILQICSQLFTFVFPPLAFCLLAKQSIRETLYLKKFHPAWLILIPSIFTVLPLINFLQEWNNTWSLGASLDSFFRTMQASTEAMTLQFVNVGDATGLIINLFSMAFLAAFGEELLFRGLLQNKLMNYCRHWWVAVLVSSIIFSAIHFELYSFMPRLILGFILGTAFYLSKSIWISVILHFFNNATIVVLYFLNNNQITHADVEKFGSSNNLFIILLSFLMTVVIFFLPLLLTKKSK